MAVIRAFLDESGMHGDAPVVTVAGYFGYPKTWRSFTTEWNKTLRPTGIKVFHATD